MKDVIGALNRYYDSFINQSKDWYFFLGLSDYVNYILETPQTKQISDSLIEERLKKEKILQTYADEAVKEMCLAKKKLIKKIEDKELNYQALNNLIKQYEKIEENKIISSIPKPINLQIHFDDILYNLQSNGHREIIKEFFISRSSNSTIINRHSYAKKTLLYRDLIDRIDDERCFEIWGAWNYLFLAAMTIWKGEEIMENFGRDTNSLLKSLGFAGMWHEMQHIKKQIKTGKHDTPHRSTYFVKDNYISYASRFHNYLIKELSKKSLRPDVQTAKSRKKAIPKARYKDGVLCFKDKKIDFNNKPNQKDPLITLFKEPARKWFYDEIQEDWDEFKRLNLVEYPKDYWRKFYTAGDSIEKAVAIETQEKNFIIKNTKEIRINPKYVS